MDPVILEKLARFEWKWIRDKNSDIQECPNPECNYLFVLDTPNPEAPQKELNCEACKQRWCLECGEKYHENYTCEENKKLN